MTDKRLEVASKAIENNSWVRVPAPEGEYGSSIVQNDPVDIAKAVLLAIDDADFEQGTIRLPLEKIHEIRADSWDEGDNRHYEEVMGRRDKNEPNPYRVERTGSTNLVDLLVGEISHNIIPVIGRNSYYEAHDMPLEPYRPAIEKAAKDILKILGLIDKTK